jgi:Domain of unknown function DUF29
MVSLHRGDHEGTARPKDATVMATRIKPARPGGGPYEADVVVWAEAQAEAPRAGRLDELDPENLAEEVADVGRRDGACHPSRAIA